MYAFLHWLFPEHVNADLGAHGLIFFLETIIIYMYYTWAPKKR